MITLKPLPAQNKPFTKTAAKTQTMVDAHVDGIAQMYGDEIAAESRKVICELLNHAMYERDVAGPWIK